MPARRQCSKGAEKPSNTIVQASFGQNRTQPHACIDHSKHHDDHTSAFVFGSSKRFPALMSDEDVQGHTVSRSVCIVCVNFDTISPPLCCLGSSSSLTEHVFGPTMTVMDCFCACCCPQWHCTVCLGLSCQTHDLKMMRVVLTRECVAH